MPPNVWLVQVVKFTFAIDGVLQFTAGKEMMEIILLHHFRHGAEAIPVSCKHILQRLCQGKRLHSPSPEAAEI